LLAVCQELDLDTGNGVIPKIAGGFGGGIGNTGAVCGAVAGAVMAFSLKMERGDTMGDWLRIASATQEFRRRFEAEMGTINCRELTGVDLNTEEGMKQAMSSDLSQKVCLPAVGTAYRLVLDLLQEIS
jgi:C_GCAxxG_C_C family probable redox protein